MLISPVEIVGPSLDALTTCHGNYFPIGLLGVFYGLKRNLFNLPCIAVKFHIAPQNDVVSRRDPSGHCAGKALKGNDSGNQLIRFQFKYRNCIHAGHRKFEIPFVVAKDKCNISKIRLGVAKWRFNVEDLLMKIINHRLYRRPFPSYCLVREIGCGLSIVLILRIANGEGAKNSRYRANCLNPICQDSGVYILPANTALNRHTYCRGDGQDCPFVIPRHAPSDLSWRNRNTSSIGGGK